MTPKAIAGNRVARMATVGNLLADDPERGSDCPLEVAGAGSGIGVGEDVDDDVDEGVCVWDVVIVTVAV